MFLRSDSIAGVHPRILAAVEAAALGEAQPYGDDDLSGRLGATLAVVFDHPAWAIPTVSGTAANAIAMATFAEPFGCVLCHDIAHIRRDEGNAVGFFSPGLQTIGVPGSHGRINPDALQRSLDGLDPKRAADPRPVGISLTQATEDGTVYTPDQIAAIAEIAHNRGLIVHMDGARLANAIAALSCHPADLTWRVGVDVLSLGATKNGTIGADAVVTFKAGLARDFGRIAKRAGLLLSKQRFLSAQLLAYLEDGLWLQNAAVANRSAAALARALATHKRIEILHPVEANIIFAALPIEFIDRLSASGYSLKPKRGKTDDTAIVRLVTSYATEMATIEGFAAALSRIE